MLHFRPGTGSPFALSTRDNRIDHADLQRRICICITVHFALDAELAHAACACSQICLSSRMSAALAKQCSAVQLIVLLCKLMADIAHVCSPAA